MIPYLDPVNRLAERSFNTLFKRARCTIERCNGVIKTKLRCTRKDRVLHYRPKNASKIIKACVVLHNFAVEKRVQDYVPRNIPLNQNDNFNADVIYDNVDQRIAGERVRNVLSQYLFNRNRQRVV